MPPKRLSFSQDDLETPTSKRGVNRTSTRDFRKPTASLMGIPRVCNGLHGSINAGPRLREPYIKNIEADMGYICDHFTLYRIHAHINYPKHTYYKCWFGTISDNVWIKEDVLVLRHGHEMFRYYKRIADVKYHVDETYMSEDEEEEVIEISSDSDF